MSVAKFKVEKKFLWEKPCGIPKKIYSTWIFEEDVWNKIEWNLERYFLSQNKSRKIEDIYYVFENKVIEIWGFYTILKSFLRVIHLQVEQVERLFWIEN